jgi:hypothetical protein
VIAPAASNTASAIATGIAQFRDGFHHCRGNRNRPTANRDHSDDVGTRSIRSGFSPG